MSLKYTTKEVIIRAQKVHGDRYDYSKFEYTGSNSPGIIICRIHGEFLQTTQAHIIAKHNCPKCAYQKIALARVMPATDYFNQCKLKHNGKLSYDKADFIKLQNKIIITCLIRGDFTQRADLYLKGNGGCKKCSGCTTESVIVQAKIVHGDLFDYSKTEYIGNKIPMTIICRIHGEFVQTTGNHISCKKGCPTCAIEYRASLCRKTKEKFVNEGRTVHGFKYHYDNVVYINSNTKVIIFCPKPEHGNFLQTPGSHISGKGCPRCASRSENEDLINLTLYEGAFMYDFERQFRLANLSKDKSRHTFDFYFPEYKVAIEYNGKQHYQKTGFSNNKEKAQLLFETQLISDKHKRQFCKEYEIDLISIDGRIYKKQALKKLVNNFIIPYLWIKEDLIENKINGKLLPLELINKLADYSIVIYKNKEFFLQDEYLNGIANIYECIDPSLVKDKISEYIYSKYNVKESQ